MRAAYALAHRFLRPGLKFLAVSGAVGTLARACARAVEVVAGSPPAGAAPTLLALSPEQFRGDLEVLARTGAFRVLRLPAAWQVRIVRAFAVDHLPGADFHMPPANGAVARGRAACREFLGRFLPELFARLGVDAVIGANNRFQVDADWGITARTLGCPYVVLFREGLLISPVVYDKVVARQRAMGRFQGDHIVVHNAISKRMYVESGYATAPQVTVAGVLRMDDFIERIREGKGAGRHRRVAFFPFGSHLAILGLDSGSNLFTSAHQAFVRTARDNPDIHFVIKPKARHLAARWRDDFDRAMAEGDLRPGAIANLEITSEPDAQDLILRSDVICGFDSTTILEAALAGRPVVVPYFDTYRCSPYGQAFPFAAFTDLLTALPTVTISVGRSGFG